MKTPKIDTLFGVQGFRWFRIPMGQMDRGSQMAAAQGPGRLANLGIHIPAPDEGCWYRISRTSSSTL